MDAELFLKEKKRMCSTISCCEVCPLSKKGGALFEICGNEIHFPTEAVRIIEGWSKAYPIQTNADKIKEVFGERGETIVRAMSNRFTLWNMWFDAPYEPPKGAE